MSSNPLKTLFMPFENGQINWPAGDILFLNGQVHENLPDNITIQQYFKPLGKGAQPKTPDSLFDMVLLHASKQHQETQHFMGQALAHLKEGGVLVCAAANDAGGKRLKSDFEALGLEPESLSKHKSRVVWTQTKGQKNSAWVKAGNAQPVLNGEFTSQPGIFGWNKIDSGSALLTKYLPNNLSGKGADFGCGYGYLANHILENNNKISELYCLDADFRAVNACKINLEKFNDVRTNYLWEDLTIAQKSITPLDWIIMNPPFHEGKNAQHSIGTSFIKTAAAALKPRGHIWIVANSHLPYEAVLKSYFSHVEKITEEQGFKIFHAIK